MKTVKVKGIGVQVQGVSYFKNEVFDVTEEDYKPIEDLVDVIEEDVLITNENDRIIMIKVEDETIDLEEAKKYLYECLLRFGKVLEPVKDEKEPEIPDGSDEEDEELEALKDRAKELDIKITANMKKETIIKKIEEAEKAKEGQDQNPEGE